MSETLAMKYRSIVVAVAPVVLAVALLWHPHIPGRLPDNAAIAAAVAADPGGWALAHLTAGLAFGVVVLAFVAVRSYLRLAGETRWSLVGLPFIVIGSALHTMLPGMELAPVAAVQSGADAEAAQAALQPYFTPVLVGGGVLFAIGVVGFAKAVAASGIVSPGVGRLVVAALLLMAAARLVPLAVVQFEVQSAAALVALMPLAYRMWRQPAPRPDLHPEGALTT
jgi:hypothetical protein